MSDGDQTKPDRATAGPVRSRWVLAFNLLMIVVFVTVVLGMLFPSINRRVPSQRSKSRVLVSCLSGALLAYHAVEGSYPAGSQAEIVASLCATNGGGQVYLQLPIGHLSPTGELLDGWKHPLRIILTNPAGPIVYSVGPNGLDDGGAPGSDDLVAP
jgi:hypothetical protein